MPRVLHFLWRHLVIFDRCKIIGGIRISYLKVMKASGKTLTPVPIKLGRILEFSDNTLYLPNS
jgi:hypothetical protein